jgi:hypothetical protein
LWNSDRNNPTCRESERDFEQSAKMGGKNAPASSHIFCLFSIGQASHSIDVLS